MGRTNIRSGEDLLSRGGSNSFDTICCIPDASLDGVHEKLVLLSNGTCDKSELDSYAELFAAGERCQNRWIHFKTHAVTYADPVLIPPPPDKMPHVLVTIGATRFWGKGVGRYENLESSQPADLVFVAIIAGNCGKGVMKFLTTTSWGRLGTLIFAEVLNGYSVIFTGACFEGEWARRLDGRGTWKPVESIEELERLRSQNSASTRPEIGMLC